MADGFSCREQISQETNREALHLAEVIHMGLQPARAGDGMYPEEPLTQRRKSTRRKARLRALGVLAGLGAAGAITWKLLKRR
jgi:ferric-dicitrate binding protein FerR (iron transport regulator)